MDEPHNRPEQSGKGLQPAGEYGTEPEQNDANQPAEDPRVEREAPGKPVTYVVLGLCLLVFALGNIGGLFDPVVLAFSPGNQPWFPGLLGHMFVHADMLGPAGTAQQTIPMHLIGNMFVLFFLGAVVEQVYGSGRYALLYFASGLIAAVSQAAIDPFAYLVGASGAISGIMAAFVRHFPNAKLYLYGILPVRAWILMAIWLIYNIYGSTAGTGLRTAFVAHLAGFAAGMVLSFVFFPPRSVVIQELGDNV